MANEPEEISLEDYDEIEDAYEIRASREKYELKCAELLELIERREKMVELLKLATTDKTAQIREVIVKIDEAIERTEELIALNYKAYEMCQELWKTDMETMALCDRIQPELLKHIAEHNPEKLEEVEAMLSDDQRSH